MSQPIRHEPHGLHSATGGWATDIVTPSQRTLDLTAGGVPAIRLTVANESRNEIALPVRELRRFEDGAWQTVTGRQGREMPTVASGETISWSLSKQVHPTPMGIVPVVYEFDPGTWAFTVVVELTPEHEGMQDLELSTVFEVKGYGD